MYFVFYSLAGRERRKGREGERGEAENREIRGGWGVGGDFFFLEREID